MTSKKMHPKDKLDQSAISLPSLRHTRRACRFTFYSTGKTLIPQRKKGKLPVDLLMVTEQTEPLREPLHLPCLPCVPQFRQWHQTFQSPGSKQEVIVSFRAHNQQLISIKLLILLCFFNFASALR